MLANCSVLDLADGGVSLCGKLLADCGADVIKIERPGGNLKDNAGPYLGDVPSNENSLFRLSYDLNKRGMTLDIEARDGQRVLRELAKKADIVVESFSPGYLDTLGLGYEALSALNPSIILTSVTPFGQTGPYRDHGASDLTLWGMGGYLFVSGDSDRPPVWLSYPQASLNGGVEAATATMIAYYHRLKSGKGQHVDVSIQCCVGMLLANTVPYWDLNHFNMTRSGYNWTTPTAIVHTAYECMDGYVSCLAFGGTEVFVASWKALVRWMDEEGMAPDWLVTFDWRNDYDATKLTQPLVDRVEACLKPFFNRKTKNELFAGALERGVLMAPVNSVADVVDFEHLKVRSFWWHIDHAWPNGERAIKVHLPGPFARFSATPVKIRRTAPRVGQHTAEILGELGLSSGEISSLKEGGVI